MRAMRKASPDKRVLLVGYFRRGNLGDNAMLEGLRAKLSQDLPDAAITDLPLPSPTDLRALPAFLRELVRSDVVVLAGGSHFHDKYGRKSLRLLGQLLLVFGLAKACGARVIYASIGVGPFASKTGCSLGARLLRLADLTVVRDETSLAQARYLAPGHRIVQGADLALLLEPPLRSETSSETRIGVSIVPFNALYFGDAAADLRMVDALARAIESLAEHSPGMHVDVFVFCESGVYSDLGVSQELVSRLQARMPATLVRTQEPAEVIERIAGLDAFVGARFHSVLLAYLCGLPVVPIIYHEKCADLVRELGLSPLQTIAPEALTAGVAPTGLLQELSKDPAAFRASLPLADARRIALLSAALIVSAIHTAQNETEVPDESALSAALPGVRRTP